MKDAKSIGNNRAKIIKVALFILGIALMLFGIFSGDCRSLFIKAIFVCMECAGIG